MCDEISYWRTIHTSGAWFLATMSLLQNPDEPLEMKRSGLSSDVQNLERHTQLKQWSWSASEHSAPASLETLPGPAEREVAPEMRLQWKEEGSHHHPRPEQTGDWLEQLQQGLVQELEQGWHQLSVNPVSLTRRFRQPAPPPQQHWKHRPAGLSPAGEIRASSG